MRSNDRRDTRGLVDDLLEEEDEAVYNQSEHKSSIRLRQTSTGNGRVLDIFNGAGGGIRTHEGLRHRVLSPGQAIFAPSAH